MINNLKGSESVTENYVEIDTNTHLNILKNHYKDIVLNTQIPLPKQFNVNIPTNRRTKKKSSKSTQLKVLKNNMNSVDENYNESAVYLYENQSSKFVAILIKQVYCNKMFNYFIRISLFKYKRLLVNIVFFVLISISVL